MAVHYRIEGGKVVIFGQTYPVKDQIKALGARFNGQDKTWVLNESEDNVQKVAALCEDSPPSSIQPLKTGQPLSPNKSQ